MSKQKGSSVAVKKVRNRAQLSCNRCKSHKRKCDREEPCGRCVQDKAECFFQRPVNQNKRIQTIQDRHLAEEHQNSKALSVADVNADTFISSAAFKRQLFTKSQRSLDKPVACLIETPFFLLRIFSIYINNVDWIGDLLKNTRIDRTIATYPCQPSREISPILWEALEPLAYIIIAITAQMMPTEVEVILMEEMEGNTLFNADLLAHEAFNAATHELSQPELIENIREWPPEHFAAFMMTHVFQKNSGDEATLNSNSIIAIEGLQQAGMHREPFLSRLGVRHDSIMEHERDLLVYRIFWSYFEKDRVRSWYSGLPPGFGNDNNGICLRGEGGSHASLNDILSNSVSTSTCACAANNSPMLSKFAFMQAKIGILIGRYYELLTNMSQRITHNNTDIARYLVSDFDSDHFALAAEIVDLSRKDYFREGQSAMLQITLQLIRTGFRSKLCELYANKIFKDQYSISQQAINWMLERRRNIAKIDLLEEGRNSCASWIASCRCSWVFTPKFMHEQLRDLIKAIEPWFTPMQIDGMQEVMPMQWLKHEDFNHLADCFNAVCQGRNTLVLMARRNELQLVKSKVQDACQLLHSFLVRSQLLKHDSEIALAVLNFNELVNISQLQFSIIGPKCLNSTRLDSVGETMQTMTSTASSSITTSPITPHEQQEMENDPAVLSTLREINSADLQKALDAWNDDLDKIFGSLDTLQSNTAVHI